MVINIKPKLFTDFDLTITDGIKSICQTYNYFYKNVKGFKKAEWYKVEKYNMKDQCTLSPNPAKLFGEEYFFQVLEFINDNTYDVLKELNEKYQIIICSVGTNKNISYKSMWIQSKLPFIRNSIYINNGDCKADKSIVNMQDSIFIDDCSSNLYSSNAKVKICFGEEYGWNNDWEGIRCVNWTDVQKLLL